MGSAHMSIALDARAHMPHAVCMSTAATTPAPDALPVRIGYLGVGTPKVPSGLGSYDAMLAELTRRTGHELEVEHFGDDENDSGHWAVFDVTAGDSLGEGATGLEALESAMESV